MRIIYKIKCFIEHRLENYEWSECIKAFGKANKKIWDSPDRDMKKGHIFIANTIHNANEFLYEVLLFAKGMEKERPSNICVLSMKKDRGIRTFVDSFGAKYRMILQYDLIVAIKTCLLIIQLFRKKLDGTKLLATECCEILIGPAIYDTILLKLGEYTIRRVNQIAYFHILWRFIYATYKLDRLFAYYTPAACIVMEEAYEAEIFRRMAVKYDVNIIWVNKMVKQYVDVNGEKTTYYQRILEREILEHFEKSEKENFEEQTQKMLKAYYEKGNESELRGRTLTGLAVKGKIYASEETIRENLKIDLNRKNVFVFCHCLTDGPHGCPNLCFNDYFEWLDETLMVAKEIKDVNWIVKFHPDRVRRNVGERRGESKIREKYNNVSNIFFFPDNYSIASVVPVADIIVTACGEVGEEMACFGIPTIAAGKPYYGNMKYIHSFSDKVEYKKCLREISKVDKLTDEEILLAKKFFYAHSISSKLIDGDTIGKLIIECNNRRLREKVAPRVINIYFLKKILENDIIKQSKKSSLYEFGKSHNI